MGNLMASSPSTIITGKHFLPPPTEKAFSKEWKKTGILTANFNFPSIMKMGGDMEK